MVWLEEALLKRGLLFHIIIYTGMTKEERKEYNRKYREANKERLLTGNREYYQSNREKIRKQRGVYQRGDSYTEHVKKRNQSPEYREYQKQYQKDYQHSSKRRDYQKEYNAQWKKANPEYLTKYYKERAAVDPAFKFINNLRVRQGAVLKGRASTTKGLGCTKEFLKEHMEKQFTEGMNWENYGHGEGKWTIDHKLPLDLIRTNPELTLQLIHYTNLQPMWFIDNIKKGKKII